MRINQRFHRARAGLVLLSLVILSACATARSNMLDDRHAIISGHGTAFDAPATVLHVTLVEAAKVTVAHGFQYFQILGSQDTTRRSVAVFPGQTYSSGTVTGFGNTATYSSQTYTTPGTAVPLVAPGVDVEIQMYRANEVSPGTPGIWNAESILAANGEKPQPASLPGTLPTTRGPASTPQPSSTSPSQGPHCTAYGCDWSK